MKRSDIKVGETYGVRTKFDEYAVVVPATVVALDEPYLYYPFKSSRSTTQAKGGVKVKFVKPTRVGYNGLNIAKNTNENAGEIEAEYVFGDKRNGGSVGKCFVGVWSELEAQRKANEKAEKETARVRSEQADVFAVELATYMNRLKKLGLSTEAYGDGSGIHGDISLRLYNTGYREGNRPTGFAHDDVHVPKPIFDKLIEIAERHGEKVTE